MDHGAQLLVVPLHEQVLKIFKQKLTGGEWPPGALIPGEAALSQELGVSVGTIRRALERLSRDRLLTRARGRGTYVMRMPETSRFGISITQVDGAVVKCNVANSYVTAKGGPIGDPIVEKFRRSVWRRSSITAVSSQWAFRGKIVANEIVYLNKSQLLNIDDKVLRDNNSRMSALETVQDHCNLEFSKLEWLLSCGTFSNTTDKGGAPQTKPEIVIHVTAMDKTSHHVLVARLSLLQANFCMRISS